VTAAAAGKASPREAFLFLAESRVLDAASFAQVSRDNAAHTDRFLIAFMSELASLLDGARIRPLVFVDLETTGGRAGTDRVTEIGVVEVSPDGVTHWSSLVNPQKPIPAFVQSLTGITDEMVCAAPTFDALADALAQRLAGKLFIAHNARFDHGFLKHEFGRVGLPFDPDVLCTVRLSRALFPHEARHGLDAVVQRLCLAPAGRHRALADADLLWQFWQRIHALHPREAIEAAIERLTRAGGADEIVDGLPAGSGVYVCFDERGTPLYVGKSARVRQRVRAQLFGDRRSSRDIQLAERVRRVNVYPVGGEVGLLLAEAHWSAVLRPELARRRPRPGGLGAPPWPYAGPIALIERDAHTGAASFHVLDAWQYLGSAPHRDGAQALVRRATCPDRATESEAAVAPPQDAPDSRVGGSLDSASADLGVIRPRFDARVLKILTQRLLRGGLTIEGLDAAPVCHTAQATAKDGDQLSAPTPPRVQMCDSAVRIASERDAS
jgi:DNA polymerase III subunit epsilon